MQLDGGAFTDGVQALATRCWGRESVRARRGSGTGEGSVVVAAADGSAGHADVGLTKERWAGRREDGLGKIGEMERRRVCGWRDMRY